MVYTGRSGPRRDDQFDRLTVVCERSISRANPCVLQFVASLGDVSNVRAATASMALSAEAPAPAPSLDAYGVRFVLLINTLLPKVARSLWWRALSRQSLYSFLDRIHRADDRNPISLDTKSAFTGK